MPKISVVRLILPLFFLLLLNSCKQKDRKSITPFQPEFNPEIAAFTSGLISNQSVVTVRLASEYNTDIEPGTGIEASIIQIKPEVAGKVYWADGRTIEFMPESKFPSGETFTVNVNLSRLLKKKDAKEFSFSFSTIPLNLDIQFSGLKAYSDTRLKWNRIEGKAYVSDIINSNDLENILTAVQENNKLKISWDQESDKIHSFIIDSVERKEVSNEIDISWDGKSAGINIKGSRTFEVPALGDFVFMEHRIIQHPDQHISLVFSDPLKYDQDLRGLVSLENNTSLKYTIEDNVIRVYPNVRQQGKLNLNIDPGIRNILGYKFQGSHNLSLNFEELKPAVRLIGEGVIIPGDKNFLFPFEAVNLRAVDVRVIKIFEDNIAHFLQVNKLSGYNQLKRAGKLVLKKTVDLIPEKPINFGEWNAFSLDLTHLIKTDPGAIYRIELSFRKKHSLYSCGNESENPELRDAEDEFEKFTEDEIAYWDASSGYYDYNYDYRYFDWNEKDDPCTDSYYNYYERKVARNVLASNIGIIAKKGLDKSVFFAITDLTNTQPLANAEIHVFNFQQQLLAKLSTNQEGIATANLDEEPFLAIASKDNEKGYLRIDRGSSLSLSQFDISGTQSKKGLKGFLYGERGVWRPGDSIFVTFILEDRDNKLPADHPVSFELSDPAGNIKKQITLTQGLNGFYPFITSTSEDDPTGFWNLKADVGGASFYKNLRIETVKPNRLKIELDFGGDMIYSTKKELTGKLSATWLHGAAAEDLRAVIDVNFKTRTTSFKNFEEYVFADASKSFITSEKVIFDGKLNDNGVATFSPDINLQNIAPGMVNAIFTTRVFEKGGDFSINRFNIPYSPYPVYCGLKSPQGNRFGILQTDSLHNFDIVSLDEYGNPVSGKDLEVKIYKLSWRWWWHAGNENLASYIGNPSQKPVYSRRITTGQNGKGRFGFTLNYPEWGRFLVHVKDLRGGHSASEIVYFDWPGWAGRSSRQDPNAASILAFSSDKTSYNTGETAKITIPTTRECRVLLSIENGTQIIDHYWLKAEGDETSFSFTVTPEMAPNVFVNVSLLQPHHQTKNDLPIRMYGVIPILVEDPASHLDPVIKMQEELKPETSTTIEISERDGKEMTYTLALVDDGLLDLTNFTTPDPWSAFYAREALGVSSFDIYNYVLGAYGGRIDGVFSIGGDRSADELTEPQKRTNRFPPMVRFEGPFHLEKDKTNKHEIDIPNYIGSVRVMVVSGYNGAYGRTENTIPVRKPLMVLSTLPRVVGPGEEVLLPVTVFTMDDKIRNVEVKLETNALFTTDSDQQSVTFSQTGDKLVYFNLNVKEKIGTGKVKVTVSSGNEKAYHEIELDVRPSNPEITEFVYAVLEPGESWQQKILLPGMKGSNSLNLEVFSIPPFDFGRRLKYLLSYPHGCIEQIASAAFPQLYLSDIMETSTERDKMTESNVKSALKKLGDFRLASGGFSYWPQATAENEWITNYAGHFLLEAKEKGYDFPNDWINSWVRYQQKTARRWTGKAYESLWHKRSQYMTQAYRLYTLALAGKPEVASMNRLRERNDVPVMASWYLVGAYALAGKEDLAGEIMNQLTTETPDYNSKQLYTYGSSIRDKSVILTVLNILEEKDRAIPVLQHIAENLSSNNWYSTQSTAFALMSIAKYLGKNNTSRGVDFEYSWDNRKWEKASTNYPVASITKNPGEQNQTFLKLKNTSEGTSYARISLSGIPLVGEDETFSNNIIMNTEFQSMDGKRLDISSLEQGTDFLAIVSLRNPGNLGDYKDLALTRIFPSGWEIQNMRMFESNLGKFDQPEYQDIRDDRVYSYFDLPAWRTVRYAVKLTASYAGKFYLPSIYCEAMYKNDISAGISGRWVEVIKPGN